MSKNNNTNSHDMIDYQSLMDTAGLSVVRQALQIVTFHNMPGKHHFYISFLTDYPGILISKYLAHKFPEEMTIVLQHQFSVLKVHLEKFEVSLSFGGVMEKLVIPFKAITSFADPSVNFCLNFVHNNHNSISLFKEKGYFDLPDLEFNNKYKSDMNSLSAEAVGWEAVFHNTVKGKNHETGFQNALDIITKEKTLENKPEMKLDELDKATDDNEAAEYDLTSYDDVKVIPISSYFTTKHKDNDI